MYIYIRVSVNWPLSRMFVFVSVSVISNQSTSRKPNYVSDLSKLDTFSHGVTTHLVKETRQQKEQWGWRLEVRGGGLD